MPSLVSEATSQNPRGIYYDGRDLRQGRAVQNGPVIPRQDQTTYSMLYRRVMWQRAAFWRPLPLDSAGPYGAFLVETSEPSLVGADVVEWQELYAEVPAARFEAEGSSYEFQEIEEDENEVERVMSLPSVTTTYNLHEYFRTIDPRAIPVQIARRYGSTRRLIYSRGAYYVSGGLVLAQDSTVKRWKGNVWERITKFVLEANSRPVAYGGP